MILKIFFIMVSHDQMAAILDLIFFPEKYQINTICKKSGAAKNIFSVVIGRGTSKLYKTTVVSTLILFILNKKSQNGEIQLSAAFAKKSQFFRKSGKYHFSLQQPQDYFVTTHLPVSFCAY